MSEEEEPNLETQVDFLEEQLDFQKDHLSSLLNIIYYSLGKSALCNASELWKQSYVKHLPKGYSTVELYYPATAMANQELREFYMNLMTEYDLE